MERETRNQEYQFSEETRGQTYRQQTEANLKENNSPKIKTILSELQDLEKMPVVALLVPVVQEKPEERKKTVSEKIVEAIAWVYRCVRRAANLSSNSRT